MGMIVGMEYKERWVKKDYWLYRVVVSDASIEVVWTEWYIWNSMSDAAVGAYDFVELRAADYFCLLWG